MHSDITFDPLKDAINCTVTWLKERVMEQKRTPKVFIYPTDEEDEAINRGIALDPDTWELTDKVFKRLKPYAIYEEERRRAGQR
ncbi:hypothetical protein QCE62_29030 [Caballeronia sp. LZ033]|uniref:hypothetical protein n=1 Tax=Caballeronia sp. LZ033 TaxID=3038566 RepID=UPI00286036FF|nr:hypothetical protein [Caballeronia sp. LZ033]MDR5817658.1 hypothetical protein [Caballeronia sp. LZ033]